MVVLATSTTLAIAKFSDGYDVTELPECWDYNVTMVTVGRYHGNCVF